MTEPTKVQHIGQALEFLNSDLCESIMGQRGEDVDGSYVDGPDLQAFNTHCPCFRCDDRTVSAAS